MTLGNRGPRDATERMRQMRRRDQPLAGGVQQLVTHARARLRRLEPWETAATLEQWAVLVDVRTAAQRAVEGEVPGALVVDRNILEWRLDPAGPDRLALAHPDVTTDIPRSRLPVLVQLGAALRTSLDATLALVPPLIDPRHPDYGQIRAPVASALAGALPASSTASASPSAACG
jgi:hypothetical protein